jgi:hypothetical protein
MTELSKRAQSLIDAARNADDATPEERARGDAAVRVALAMHGVTDLPALEPPLQSAPYPDATPAAPITHAGLGLNIGIGVALLSATLVAVLARTSTDAPRRAEGAESAPTARTARQVPAEPAPAPPQVTLAEPQTAPELARSNASTLPRRRTHGRPAASSAELEAEVRLISTANGLVRTRRFADALRVLEEHSQRFPRGALREEGRALRVLSLCGTDARDARALRERERFLRRSPSAVLAERVRSSCVAGGGS